MVGRRDELAALVEAVAHPPAIVVVEGESGVGKTRLVQAGLRDPRLAATRRLIGYCQETGAAHPLGPLVEALSGLSGTLRTAELSSLAGALRLLLPEFDQPSPPPRPPSDGSGDVQIDRQQVFRAALAVLEAAGPAVLVIEDLHWMDAVTAEFLSVLACHLPDELTLVVTYRPEELDPASLAWLTRRQPGVDLVHLHPKPLTPAQVADLVRAWLDTDTVSNEFAAFVHERTAGLPFAVEELVRLLIDRADIVRREGHWVRRTLNQLEVPTAVRDTVLARLAALPDQAGEVAEALAVLAAHASAELLSQVCGLDDAATLTGLTALDEAGLLIEASPGRYELRHALARQAVEEAIATPRRRWLHRRAARVLEDRDEPAPAVLARHHREAGEVIQWARCAEAAAHAALSAGNEPVAVDLLHDLVAEPVTDDNTRVRLAALYCRAALESRSHEDAAAVVRGVLEETEVLGAPLGELHHRLGLLLDQSGRPQDARREFERALVHLDDDSGLAARSLSHLGYPWVPQISIVEHREWLEKAVETSARADEGDRADVHADLLCVRILAGEPQAWPDAQRLLDELSPEGSRQLRFAFNLTASLLAVGHLERATALLEMVERLVAETDDHRIGRPATGLRLYLDWATGAWDGLAKRADRLGLDAADSPTAATAARLVGAALATVHGDLDAGLEVLAQVLVDAYDSGEFPMYMASCAEMTRLRNARDDLEGALDVAEHGLELARGKDLWTWAGDLLPPAVHALAATGHAGRAEALLDHVAMNLDGRDSPAADAGLIQARAILDEDAGDHLAAVDGYRKTAEAWTALPRPHLGALATAAAGQTLSALDRDAGVQLLEQARQQLAGLGADWDTARVRKMLRAHGVRMTHHRGRKGYGDQLSPREHEVAELAVNGLPNRDIAEILVLSPRTVETHISNILSKLAISSREEIELPDR